MAHRKKKIDLTQIVAGVFVWTGFTAFMFVGFAVMIYGG